MLAEEPIKNPYKSLFTNVLDQTSNSLQQEYWQKLEVFGLNNLFLKLFVLLVHFV